MATEDIMQNFDITQLPKSAVFLSRTRVLEDQLPSILDDFQKYYVFYNKNPEYDEYQKMFDNIKSNLHTINSNLFSVMNDVDSATESVNKKLAALNVLIRREKLKNTLLKRRLGIAEDKYNGSDEMISNYKEMYEVKYLRNWSMLLGVVVLSIAMGKTFKSRNTQSV